MAYCQASDLLLGGLGVGTTDLTPYINMASRDIDGALGNIYNVPFTGLDAVDTARITKVAIYLATGHAMLAFGSGHEDQQINSYGAYLLREGSKELQEIASGRIDLRSASRPAVAAGQTLGPSVVNVDASSAFDTFYDFTSGHCVNTWAPGKPTP